MISFLSHVNAISLSNFIIFCVWNLTGRYLEQRDKEMHQKAKAKIKECYERNKNGDPEFKSLTQSMRSHLRNTVGEKYWKKAHDCMDHFLCQKQDSRKSESGGQSSRSNSILYNPLHVTLKQRRDDWTRWRSSIDPNWIDEANNPGLPEWIASFNLADDTLALASIFDKEDSDDNDSIADSIAEKEEADDPLVEFDLEDGIPSKIPLYR